MVLVNGLREVGAGLGICLGSQLLKPESFGLDLLRRDGC